MSDRGGPFEDSERPARSGGASRGRSKKAAGVASARAAQSLPRDSGQGARSTGASRRSEAPGRRSTDARTRVTTTRGAKGAPASCGPGVPQGERFAVQGLVGCGGMGEVRCVLDQHLRRHVAVKTVKGDLDWSRAREKFLEEVEVTAQLEHPNVVPVHDIVIDDSGRPVSMTMQLIEGQTLGALMRLHPREKRTGRVLERLLHVFVRVCDAVAFAHGRGVVHCDLKPENIMVGAHGQVYVMDWGCATLLEESWPPDGPASGPLVTVSTGGIDTGGDIVGTISCMSPEQAAGDPLAIDGRTDVFALGGILHRILTDHPLREPKDDSEGERMALAGVVTPPHEIEGGQDLPPGLCAIAMKALAARPQDRYQRVEDLKADVERFLRGGTWFPSRTFKAGTLIVQQGDVADAAYVITRGTCEVFKVEKGRRVSLRRMGPGESFGETAFLEGERRTSSVVALDDVTVIVLACETLRTELAPDSWLGSFLESIIRRFHDLDRRLSDARKGARSESVRAFVLAAVRTAESQGLAGADLESLVALVRSELGASLRDVRDAAAATGFLVVDARKGIVRREAR